MLAVEVLFAMSVAIVGRECDLRLSCIELRSVHGNIIRVYILSFRAV